MRGKLPNVPQDIDMNVKLVQARHPQQEVAEPRMLAHAEYPIEQSFHSDDPLTQQRLMEPASRGTDEPDQALFVTDCNGLRVLGRSEAALDRVASALRARFGRTLVVDAPRVRYADRAPVLEPYMVVLVSAPAGYLAAVRKDFAARRGRITRIVERGTFVLEGEAPLAGLLGYQRRMRDVLGEHWDESHVAMWLSRYVPIDGDGPEAA
jgi:hypothetical protein